MTKAIIVLGIFLLLSYPIRHPKKDWHGIKKVGHAVKVVVL